MDRHDPYSKLSHTREEPGFYNEIVDQSSMALEDVTTWMNYGPYPRPNNFLYGDLLSSEGSSAAYDVVVAAYDEVAETLFGYN